MQERNETWGELKAASYQDFTDESCCYRFHRYSKDENTWRYELLMKTWDNQGHVKILSVHEDARKEQRDRKDRAEIEQRLSQQLQERSAKLCLVGHRRIVHAVSPSTGPTDGPPETVDELRRQVIDLRKRAEEAETRARRAEGKGALR